MLNVNVQYVHVSNLLELQSEVKHRLVLKMTFYLFVLVLFMCTYTFFSPRTSYYTLLWLYSIHSEGINKGIYICNQHITHTEHFLVLNSLNKCSYYVCGATQAKEQQFCVDKEVVVWPLTFKTQNRDVCLVFTSRNCFISSICRLCCSAFNVF